MEGVANAVNQALKEASDNAQAWGGQSWGGTPTTEQKPKKGKAKLLTTALDELCKLKRAKLEISKACQCHL